MNNSQVTKTVRQIRLNSPSLSLDKATQIAEKRVSKYPILYRLSDEWDKLHNDRKTAGDEHQYPLIVKMDRIKDILKKRYNYTTTY